MSGRPFQYPRVTIILPVYNRRHLVDRAIESVFKQTFTDWELLIIDDGSQDNLQEIIQPITTQNSKVRYMRHRHSGLAYSRNVGIHAALGYFVTFLDSDDEYLHNHLQIRVNFFNEHNDVDIIYGGVELVGSTEYHYVVDAFNPDKKIHIKECVVGATLFGRKASFIESGGFMDMPYSAESEFVDRASQKFVIQKVDFSTYRYYTGLEDSICAKVKRGKV